MTRRLARLAATLIGGSVALAACGSSVGSSSGAPRQAGPPAPVVGFVNAMGMEQAPILAAMRDVHSVLIDGYRFYRGNVDGVQVVDVRSGEKEYAAELATTLLDTHFSVRAAILTGTAGSRNPAIDVGDVVIGGFVVDKSSIHFHDRGYLSPYTGVEMELTPRSDTAGGQVGGYGAVGPTPADAARYGSGPSAITHQYVYFEDLAAPRSLVLAALAHLPTLGATPRSVATGDPSATGSIPAEAVVGVIGSANQWTEPLADQELQNALYQSDAGENEGMGFAYANAQLGVPSLVVRGISDSPWYPAAYDGVLAATRAAEVGLAVATHLPRVIGRAPVSLADLGRQTNAARAGYVVAERVELTTTGSVRAVQFATATGKTVTEAWPFGSEYEPSAGTAGG
ncbi:MAG: nucleoside phosphorylase [Actinomycetota bacterium]|nr:nucleoside phosphorylase [Actinomycetota bacterium]